MTKQVGPVTPKIVFPCDNYTIKVVGRKTHDYSDWVLSCVKQYVPNLPTYKVQIVDSRNGKFQSVRLVMCAQSQSQLQAIHQALMISGRVQMVI